MTLDYVRDRLVQAGWRDVRPGLHMEVAFDLVGRRRFTLTKWSALVKALPVLDQATAAQWAAHFERISAQSKSWLWGQCFIMCLIADEVSPEVAAEPGPDSFGLFGLIRLKGGGGNALVADRRSKQVYGRVPALPYDVHRFSKSLMEILQGAVQL